MAISLRASGAVSSNTLSPNPSFPAGVQANDINVLTVVAKPKAGVFPADVAITTPAGWKRIFDGRNNNFAPLNPPGSTGSVRIAVYVRTGSAFTGSIGAITITNCSVAAAVINTYAGSTGTGWNTATTYGYDTSGSTYDSNWSLASVNGFHTTGDWLLSLTALGNNIGLGTATLTATGATLGTVNVRQSAGSSIASPSAVLGLDVRDAAVSSGTSTAGARLTGTANQNGISVFIRLREGVNSLAGSETVSGVDAGSLGALMERPVTREWVNGDDVSATLLNAHFRDPISWLLTEAPAIQVRCITEPTLTTSPHTITWNQLNYRRGTIGYSGTKVTVPAQGIYIGQVQIGLRDIGAMGVGYLLTVEALTYPGGSGAATVHNLSYTFTTMDTEQSFVVNAPLMLSLNAGDAIEIRLSGYNTAGGTALWASDPFGVATRLDLHWYAMWDGVSR